MKFRKILPFIGILIFAYLIFRIGLDKILGSILSANIYLLILALLFSFIALIPPIIKWMVVLRSQNIMLNFWTLFRIDFMGIFYGSITPGRVGTFIRAYYLRDKIKKPLGACISSVVVDKMLDLLAMGVFAVIGSILLLNKISGLFTAVFIAFILLFGTFIFFLNKKRSTFILKRVWKIFIPQKFKKIALETFNSFYGNLPKIKTIFVPFLIALISLVFAFTTVYIVAKAFSINIPYIYIITIWSLATIVSLIPITIAGLGTREAVLITLFSVFNVAATDIVAMSIVAYIISHVIPDILGWFFAIRWKYED